jgi:hypothetical protein
MYTFIKLENYIGAVAMDQLESIIQPMNYWGIKEDRQVQVAKTTAHQRLIFKV